MTDTTDPNWERKTIEKLAYSALEEQKRTRRWGIFFKLLTFLYLLFVLFAALGWLRHGSAVSSAEHTAVVDVRGVIADGNEASAERIMQGLRSAFEDTKTKGVVLRVNSPGGSPVQAGQVNDEIKRLRAKYPKIPLYAVVDDVCASGGYYIAVAADKIFVDKASLIGSIGVLMDGFGFTGTMEKLGVERRLITAGANKGLLDPFSPLDPKHAEYARRMIGQIHQQFIKVVRDGRGARLKETSDMFTGLIWSGEEGIKLGLADGLGGLDYVAREVIKAEDIVDYSAHESLPERLAKRFGIGAASALMNSGATLPQLK
jgi:protease IV